MARPCKNVNVLSKHLTKEEMENRKALEGKLKGDNNKIEPPSYLSKKQRKIFRYIVKELNEAEILSNLDIYILSSTAIAINRLQEIEELVNEDTTKLLDRKLMSSRKDYQSDFFRCCNELSLSPQARAKLSNINIQAQENSNDELLNILKGDDE
ncbi:phage terminase small subunit P27 family [Clostridium perfringens]|nr:phage terminase small subunit P27 family [Clostridium perfringens]ELC8460804.1 phage terminase small subunit P27 family [Clostridium perfringens]